MEGVLSPLSSRPQRSVPGFPTSPLSPATKYVVLLKENHKQLTEAATLHRKSGGAERPAVSPHQQLIANGRCTLPLSSRPQRSGAEGPAVPRTFPGNVFQLS